MGRLQLRRPVIKYRYNGRQIEEVDELWWQRVGCYQPDAGYIYTTYAGARTALRNHLIFLRVCAELDVKNITQWLKDNP